MNSGTYIKDIITQIPLAKVCDKLDMPLRRVGGQQTALCPFHQDRRPSLHIYPDHFHCFACQAHGDLFSLVQKVKGCDFRESLNWVETNFPEVLKNKPRQFSKSFPKLTPYQLALRLYASADNGILERFAAERNFSEQFLRSVEVYGTDGKVLVSNASRMEYEPLMDQQLIVRNTEASLGAAEFYRDYFRNPRLLFTLRNAEGEIVGFAGRSENGETPKYLFTKGLAKDNLLYRLDAVAMHANQQEATGEVRSLFVVEGLFDALRLETLKKDAVAVLGSRLTGGQVHLLERHLIQERQRNRAFELFCFLDSDRAGINGAFELIKSVWRSDILRYTPLRIVLNKEGIQTDDTAQKDPDQILMGKTQENAAQWVETHQLHPLEFLLRYFLDSRKLLFEKEALLQQQFEALPFAQRVQIANQIANLFEESVWTELLDFYQDSGTTPDEAYALEYLSGSILHRGTGGPISASSQRPENAYLLALELARTGYLQENFPLDEASWDRMQAGIDMLALHFEERLKKPADCKSLLRCDYPLLAFHMPKDADTDRLKALPSHEDLILQQFVLNELLSDDDFAGYARNIPAVRYDPEIGGVYTTGLPIADIFAHQSTRAVSFAYQVDMPVLRGLHHAKHGMFRPYYDCWKDFIGFLEEGIDLLESEKIYRIKLDIRGYYDNIRQSTVIDALASPFRSAFTYSSDKFQWLVDGDDPSKRAQDVTDLLLEGLFGWRYVDPETGNATRSDALRGIAQGPALSAYAANALLFSLDCAVQEYINKVNEKCEDSHICIRYARYVDDMVVLASKAEYLAEVERIISEQLSKIGLELSPKTDHPNAVGKEDAMQWLFDERGGLGVSGLCQEVEDPLESIWNDDYEVYAVNRHNALAVLRSTPDFLERLERNDASEEGSELWQADHDRFEAACTACFKTETIRYRDVCRLAAFILKWSVRAQKVHETDDTINDLNLYTVFDKEWMQGRQKMGTLRSILSRDDTESLAFLDGLSIILKETIPPTLPPTERQARQRVQSLTARWITNDDSFDQVYEQKLNLGKNKAYMSVRLLELKTLAQEQLRRMDTPIASLLPTESPVLKEADVARYCRRWDYSRLASVGSSKNDDLLFRELPLGVGDDVQMFLYLTARLAICKNANEYQSVASLFREKTNDTPSSMLRIASIWFLKSEDNSTVYNSAEANLALRILSNFVRKAYLAEIVCQNPVLRHTLFGNASHATILPVPPAVEYPGIFAIEPDKNTAYRAELKSSGENVSSVEAPDLPWISTDSKAESWHTYKAQLEGAWEPLVSPLPTSTSEWTPQSVGDVVALFEQLCKVTQEKYPNHILSKFHLYKTNDGLYPLTYKQGGATKPMGVAIAGRSNLLRWVQLDDGPCKPSRAAAFLLEDLLELQQFPLEGGQSESILKILFYGISRLTGRHMSRFLDGYSENSFKKSNDRTLESMRRFANALDLESCELILLDITLTDKLSSMLLNRADIELRRGEDSMLLHQWVSVVLQDKSLSLHHALHRWQNAPAFPRQLRRAAAVWLDLGARLYQCSESFCYAVHALGASALMEAVCCDMRAIVLERIWSMSISDLDTLPAELPLDILTVDAQNLILWHGSHDSVEQQSELLCRKMRQYRGGFLTNLEFITPIGWYLLLRWVLQPDRNGAFPFLIGAENCVGADWNTVHSNLGQIEQMLFPIVPASAAEEAAPFPYENLSALIDIWTPEKAKSILESLQLLGDLLGFRITRKESPTPLVAMWQNGRCIIFSGVSSPIKVPSQFITMIRDASQLSEYEAKDNLFIWTQTMLGGSMLGASMVTQPIADLQLYSALEGDGTPRPASPMTEPAAASEASSPAGSIDTESSDSEPAMALEPASADSNNAAGQSASSSEPIADHESSSEKDASSDTAAANNAAQKGAIIERLKSFQAKQVSNWKTRKNIYAHLDRIALFQFDVDDSYVHPLSECCIKENEPDTPEDGGESRLPIRAIKESPQLWNRQTAMRYGNKLCSCAEFRRRKLLEAAFFACKQFDVDILLLPEYSVRSETVQWVCEKLQDDDCHLSVWAGTCRLFPGRNERIFGALSSEAYDFSAVLPILSNDVNQASDKNQKIELILRRFKKYPSISAQEVINPTMQGELSPVMKLDGRLYQDARDDVTELICAEVFLATNPSNVVPFVCSYDMLQNRFSGNPMDIEREQNAVLGDIFTIGKYTSLMQLKENYPTAERKTGTGTGKYGRTPILLVPAYTKRTTDYFVSGQAGYLAAGLTTVFCNAVGLGTRGESCFIGTDSWEMDNSEKSPYMPNYTLYHGALPGIYRQFDNKAGHGALGKEEQALVICDVNPTSAVWRPRPESMFEPLTLVAHLPIIESCTYRSPMKDEKRLTCAPYIYCRCNRGEVRGKKGNDRALEALSEIMDIWDSLTATDGKSSGLPAEYVTTSHDLESDKLSSALERLGLEIKSRGLLERAECYRKFHRNNPQLMKSPTMLDWLWVDVAYPENNEENPLPQIDVPPYTEASSEDEGQDTSKEASEKDDV